MEQHQPVSGVCFVGRLSHHDAGWLSVLLRVVGSAGFCWTPDLGLDLCVCGAVIHCPAGGALLSTCWTGNRRQDGLRWKALEIQTQRSACVSPDCGSDAGSVVLWGSAGRFRDAQDLLSAKPLLRFVLGQSMDPRLGIIDVKHFVMVRIGFIGWAMMDVNYLLTAVEMKNVSLSLLLVVVFQLIYILDFLIDESSVLTTKEFTEEPIGFIMILGEFIWIPFFSSLPVYFLLQRPNHIHFLSAVLICVLFAAGFLIYYLSNEEKDGFRRNPNDPAYARLKTIRSPAGSSLLVSGWFGWVRHPNYSGDILMMFAWCLPCGFSSVLPYFPALQCFQLLRQRANEIEESCLKKHRDAWREYCRRVPYKLLPYVY
ncbi:delta(14)-sterol reductase TM7SF2 isoform X3 [Onychostoma macrolepis]|uniref:delta(14)-sterol reductase TM7SF2 isoform X3 n=1 Tax=Onychostoma macrolepis TaxID=369639 RepID=UPI00272B9054|nr:delta(14)-sterol reductase TM7SF2 isoform X3 [Onychostoma macrolepis]